MITDTSDSPIYETDRLKFSGLCCKIQLQQRGGVWFQRHIWYPPTPHVDDVREDPWIRSVQIPPGPTYKELPKVDDSPIHPDTADLTTLKDRLRGVYRVPINDGLGAVGAGDEPDNPNEFVRTFEVPPIQRAALAEIERLEARVAELEAPAEARIKCMVDRFLAWRLPETFSPDGGISFDPVFSPVRQDRLHEPTGTNLFTAVEAEAMVRHLLDDTAEKAKEGS